MKIIIQHNWTTGLGDLFCASTEYLNFIQEFKNKGVESELIFSFNGSTGNKFIGLNDFDKIYNLESFKVFDKITVRLESYKEKEIDGCSYKHTQYGPKNPGVHWWDVFSDFDLGFVEYPNYCPQSFLNGKEKPVIYPKFNKKIEELINFFESEIGKDYDFIQIRHHDYSEHNENFEKDIWELYKLIKTSDKKFHIGSNNQFALDVLTSLDNVYVYRFSNLSLFSNDHPYYYYNKHISNNLLLERLYENIAEMCSIKNANNIFLYTTFSWVSNFLYYGLTQREKELHFEKINNNLEKILI